MHEICIAFGGYYMYKRWKKWMPIKNDIIASYLIFQTLHFQECITCVEFHFSKFLIPIPKLQFWNWNEAQSIKGISQQKEEKRGRKLWMSSSPKLALKGHSQSLSPPPANTRAYLRRGKYFTAYKLSV